MARKADPADDDTKISPYWEELLQGDSAALVQAKIDLGLMLGEMRDEAVQYRRASGIETVWLECEEAYAGIDDANRGEFTSAKWTKGMTPSGPLMSDTGRGKGNAPVKSTAFVRATARYVDAATAKVCEITISPDERGFTLKAPVEPDLVVGTKDNRTITMGGQPVYQPIQNELDDEDDIGMVSPVLSPAGGGAQILPFPTPTSLSTGNPLPQGQDQGQAAPQQPQGMMAPQQGGPSQAPGSSQGTQPPGMAPVTIADIAQHEIDKMEQAAEKAQAEIYDWQDRAGHNPKKRRIVFDGAKLGTGILKGPIPREDRDMALTTPANGIKVLSVKKKVRPGEEAVDPWNFFPDPSCGENVHDGAFVFERDFWSPSQLRRLKKQAGYDPDAIEAVLREGPRDVTLTTKEQGNPTMSSGASALTKSKRFEVWFGYAEVTVSDFRLVNGCDASNDGFGDRDDESIFAICTLINDTVIRLAINPLESGGFPYRVFRWRRREGSWTGVGIAEQMRTPQKIINGATRRMLDNAGFSAGIQFIIDRTKITPHNGVWELAPDKFWESLPGTEIDDIRKAMGIIEIPPATAQLMTIIDYGFRLAEESTNIPLITQGFSGENDPDTLGQSVMQNNNATQLLRDVAFSLADDVEDPLIHDYYEWLLLDPDIPDDMKGDYEVSVHSAYAMIERHVQDQTILQLGPMVVNPAYGLDPKKWAQQFLKAKKLNPEHFAMTAAQLAAAAQQASSSPQLSVAQLNNASREKIAQMNASTASNRDAILAQAETQRDQSAAELAQGKLDLQKEIANLEYQLAIMKEASTEKISLQEMQTKLADTTARLQAQKNLAAVDAAVKLHQHHVPQAIASPPDISAPKAIEPPVQVPGRAPNGAAFQQV